MHLINIFETDAESVAFQVLTTSGVGMLFGAIYFRCGNIWVSVILHALFDSVLYIIALGSSSTNVGSGSAGSFVFLAVLVGITLFLLRKSKISQVQEAWGGIIKTKGLAGEGADENSLDSSSLNSDSLTEKGAGSSLDSNSPIEKDADDNISDADL